MISVAVVDDEPLFADGLAMILDAQPDLRVLWQAGDGAEAVRRHAGQPPDVLLCDIQMPVLDGLETVRSLVAAGAMTRIVMLTTFAANEYVLGAIERGASGFLLKNTPPADLIAAIRTVHRGDAVISPGPTRELFATYRRAAAQRPATVPRPDGDDARSALTRRESEVIRLIASGMSNREICDHLWLSMPTVKTHVGNLMAKTGSRDRVQLVLHALRSGIAAID
ncbi:response regulator [Arenivirga flava]|uniref:DNA-binding response regulator n=1 Tax=Arenivirga flava TaxID=1930060 RepID=A0AA37UGM0_9MICO|nr:response regulator transcription factor [Arenivirga flava]GMA27701.1 DNA-binding response regulator [Arenivirga flava]